ncbi:MAG: DUF5906 domain-containing protein, partial [Cetobacterium sp.]
TVPLEKSLCLKNSSVVVKLKDDGKAKQEIEIFINKRFIANAPSKGYSAVNGTFIKFNELMEIDPEKIDALNSLSCKIELCKNYESAEFNTGKTDTYLNKAYSNIPEIKKFKDGEWSGYNYTKNEIFRFYIALNQEEEFLNILQSNWGGYYQSWKDFPTKYLSITDGNRMPSKNTDHIEWLKKVGALKAVNKKDALMDKMEAIFRSIAGSRPLRVGDSTFIYNGKSYEWLNPLEYSKKIYKMYKDINKKRLTKEENNELVYHFEMFLYDEGIEHNPADKLEKPLSINLAFKNGTLYISKSGTVFKEGYYDSSDNVFIEFSVDYAESKKKGLLNEWVLKRFDTNEKFKFFQMVIGDLFSTNANTDVHGYFWGGAEIGKSTFASLLQKVSTKGTVDFMKLDKIKDPFSRVKVLRTPIMIADESSERNIPESEYKSMISREPDDYQMKYVQNFNGQPIAKFLTFANVLPNIKMDEGVKRRLCVLQVNPERVATHLEKQVFAEEFGKCEVEVINFIVDGVKECFGESWDLSRYYKNNFAAEQNITIFTNDNFSYFIDHCFDLTETKDNEYSVTSMEAFTIYNQFLTTLEGTAINKMSVTKFGLKLRELGVGRKSTKIDGKVVKVLERFKFTEKSLNLLLQHYPDTDDLTNQKIRMKIAKIKKR